MDVDVALVIPNHNGAHWLPGVLGSVAAQTVAPAEVLVVADGSTDGSAQVAAECDGVRVLALEGNGGFARAVNAGIAAVGTLKSRKPRRGRAFSMGDTGLEPVTSALSRRRSPS